MIQQFTTIMLMKIKFQLKKYISTQIHTHKSPPFVPTSTTQILHTHTHTDVLGKTLTSTCT